eukprot:GHVL01041086.1.p1 GENE.GHVL01041086.1~~GHVL01041086.1.p1  ORF type:complete len:103 (-),score=14.97 GHVL01041086.1:35-343(-)
MNNGDDQQAIRPPQFAGEMAPSSIYVVEATDDSVINQFPISEYSPPRDEKKIRICYVCLEKFQKKDALCWLPCMHEYHKQCIHQWLKRSTKCPFCKFDVRNK